MRRRIRLLLLAVLCLSIGLSGCRRKPIETETQKETAASETQTEKDAGTEKQSESKTEKTTESGTKKTPQSTAQKHTTVTPSSITPKPSSSPQKSPSPSPKGQTQTCPYCAGSFSTVTGADGSSEYSSHVAQEEAYIRAIGGDPATYQSGVPSSTPDSSQGNGSGGQTGGTTGNGDWSGYQTGDDGTLYAQCPYCFQWFSDTADSTGYSPYAQHVAAETAYLNQQGGEEYVQCPICGNWVTQSDYQVHQANGW